LHFSLGARALSRLPTIPDVATLTAGLQQGAFALRQRIATWLFPSHTGKSPRSTQQFAAIETLINFEVRIGTFGLNAQAAEAFRFIASSRHHLIPDTTEDPTYNGGRND
jgi:hypothetical protein